MYLLYSLLLTVAFLVALPWFAWRDLETGKYRRSFAARLGRGGSLPPADERPVVWVHAVSVGEVLAIRPLLRALRPAFPGHALFLSTSTLTGQQIARREAALVDAVFYAPFDWAFTVRPVLDRLRPRLLVLVETELWPRLIHEARRRGTRVAIVNGRISPGSFAGYRRIRTFLERVLAEVDLFAMQGEAHAERIVALGAPRRRVRVTGNVKYDALEAPEIAAGLAQLLGGGGPLWVAGSTAAGEEEPILHAHRVLRQRVADARLLIAPRHPERFDAVCRLVETAGFACVRRSRLTAPWDGEGVLVLDSLGELAGVYPLATLAFVGGSLVPAGGHNILEAAVAGVPVVVGPHMENFQEMAESFVAAGALLQIAGPVELAAVVSETFADPHRRRQLAGAARALIDAQRGAAERTVRALGEMFSDADRGAAAGQGVA